MDGPGAGAISGGVQIDWENDLCWLTAHSIVAHGHRIYVMGGDMALVPEKQIWLDGEVMGNGHLRILDFSRSLDLSQDDMTRVLRLDRHVPVLGRPHLFANANSLYQFGSIMAVTRFFNDTGYMLPENERPPPGNTKVYRFNLIHEEWDMSWESRLGEETPWGALHAMNQDAAVGWVYGTWKKDVLLKGLVKFDMQDKEQPVGEWVKQVISEVVPGLVLGELVYLGEVGKDGMLVVIGGAVFNTTIHSQPSLHTINVYDIASQKWFTQESSPASNSNSTPSASTDVERGGYCAVAVSARDNSSHNIYMYAGRSWRMANSDPAHQADNAELVGDMWILSLPSFTWIGPVAMGGMDAVGGSTKLEDHRCAVMQNRYMVVYQGREWGEQGYVCNRNRGIRLFDLQSMEWTTRYEFSNDPAPYRVPKVVYDVIGGDENGGATLTLPKAYVDPTLKEILAPATSTPSGSLIAGGALISWLFYLRRRNKQHTVAPHTQAASDGAECYTKAELEDVVPKELAAHQVEAPVGYSNPAQDITPLNFELVELPEHAPQVCHEMGCEAPCRNHGSEVVL
ncbi:hypothetical protein BDZ91DRAFT_218015 [Kalaharituber pfeilii]|nr:hypothetical protein BDZ91DRAFT_218015 [Kalaharituber pfeilii]